MKLSTGKVAFPIEFDNGDNTVIYFNPFDPDLMIRLKNFQSRMNNKIQELEDIELSNEGKPVYSSDVDAFEKIQDIFKQELDFAFGGSISNEIFKYCSPFAIVNGEYFISQFLEAITPEIERHIKKMSAESEKKMSKHLDKYKK